MLLPIKIIALFFALSGLGCAIAAAIYWFRASRVYPYQPIQSIGDVPALHIMSTNVAIGEAGDMNAKAAILTGAAAVLSALGSVLGLF
jgi:hypothetical protein